MGFRPADDPRNRQMGPDLGPPTDWEDNSFSNLLACASWRLVPSWCQTSEHWTSVLTSHLFTDCPCCLLFRGLILGLGCGLFWGLLAGVLVGRTWP